MGPGWESSIGSRGLHRLWLGLLAGCLAAALAPAGARAAVIVGADNLAQNPGAGAASCAAPPGEPCSFYTITQHDGVAENGSPITGVLVSARVQTAGAAVTIAVRVLRPTTALTFLNVGPEIPIPVGLSLTIPGHRTEATNLHHPINVGDRLGVGWTQPAIGSVFISGNAAPGMATCGFRLGAGNEHPVGTAQTYSDVGCGAEMLVQGTVEPDADGDAFGDETQDQCPTNAATAGPCPPAAAPPVTAPRKKKCKKKKKRAGAAKKKCRKKRR